MQQNIHMVDLKGQYQKIKKEIDNVIHSVLDSGLFIKGEEVKTFENKLANYLQVKHVITCANGTDALQIALMVLSLKPGDEIITTSFTFVAIAEVIALLNLQPVFVDVDPDTFLINIQEIEKKISSKTKAIIPVHLFGQSTNMEELLNLAKKHNLYIIEDTAQALGADYYFSNMGKSKVGTIGTIGTTSFFPSKNLGCYGDGGALFTDDDQIAENIRSISNHGMKTRYYHDMIGINSRLDTIQAAILNVKLEHLNQYNKSRQIAADYYDKGFKECKSLSIPTRIKCSSHIFHQYTLLMDRNENKQMVEHLKNYNIPSMIYYPVPIHLQKGYKCYEYKEGDLPITESLSKRVFSIPMHTELTIEQQDYIIEKVIKYFK